LHLIKLKPTTILGHELHRLVCSRSFFSLVEAKYHVPAVHIVR